MLKEDIINQHKEILISASMELVQNNNNSLIEDDIIKGVIDVPLETMDFLKQKFVNIAKNNNLILDSDRFNLILEDYKDCLKNSIRKIYVERVNIIKTGYDKFDNNKPMVLVKDLKKDLNKFNKSVKKYTKEEINLLVKEKLINNLDVIVNKNGTSFKKEVEKYLQSAYVKQVLETIDMKLLIKDTILLNSLKEHLTRFIFTMENSHLFD